jgi:hypothetical protein
MSKFLLTCRKRPTRIRGAVAAEYAAEQTAASNPFRGLHAHTPNRSNLAIDGLSAAACSSFLSATVEPLAIGATTALVRASFDFEHTGWFSPITTATPSPKPASATFATSSVFDAAPAANFGPYCATFGDAIPAVQFIFLSSTESCHWSSFDDDPDSDAATTGHSNFLPTASATTAREETAADTTAARFSGGARRRRRNVKDRLGNCPK